MITFATEVVLLGKLGENKVRKRIITKTVLLRIANYPLSTLNYQLFTLSCQKTKTELSCVRNIVSFNGNIYVVNFDGSGGTVGTNLNGQFL
jgi:hypothetical protein